MKKKVALIDAKSKKGKVHFSELRRSDYFELVAIFDNDKNADFGRFEVFDDLEILFSKTMPEAVVIATETNKHKEFILKCMKFCKNILVQAPLSGSLSENREINYATKANKINIAIAYNNRFNPTIISLLREIEKGEEILNMNFINADFNETGDLISNFLIKDIDLAKYLSQKEISNFTLKQAVFGEKKVAKIINANVKFKCEVLGNFCTSCLYPNRRHKVEICTKTGFYIADLINLTLHKHTPNGLVNLRVDSENFAIRKIHEKFYNFCNTGNFDGLVNIEECIKIKEIL